MEPSLSRQAIAEGIRCFEEAIAEDAGYALAYTGLADSYALQVDYRGAPVREGLERARASARARSSPSCTGAPR